MVLSKIREINFLRLLSHLFILAACSFWTMAPLARARFHPIDDHEFAAMLSLQEQSVFRRLIVKSLDMSPLAGYPEGLHWRPIVWMSRAVESEIFGTRVWAYFFYRSILLSLLGLLVFVIGLSFANYFEPGSHRSLIRTAPSLAVALLAIANPHQNDVFGRLLPGEMYTLLGLGLWTIVLFSSRPGSRIDRVDLVTLSLFLPAGLLLLGSGKEDGVVLFPLALVFGFTGIRNILRQERQLFIRLGLAVASFSWFAGSYSLIFSLVYRGSRLPYQPLEEERSRVEVVQHALGAISGSQWLLLALVFLITLLFYLLRASCASRVCAFLSCLILVEVIYTSSVSVTAPRYEAVRVLAALIVVSALIQFIISRFEKMKLWRPVVVNVVIFTLAMLTLSNANKQRALNERYVEISVEWQAEIDLISNKIRSTDFEQILVVVDPPKPSSIGRLEKTFSLGKFLRYEFRGSSSLPTYMEVMDSRAPGLDGNARRALERVERNGSIDAAGVIFGRLEDFKNLPTFCIVYSESGREFRLRSLCREVHRLAL